MSQRNIQKMENVGSSDTRFGHIYLPNYTASHFKS